MKLHWIERRAHAKELREWLKAQGEDLLDNDKHLARAVRASIMAGTLLYRPDVSSLDGETAVGILQREVRAMIEAEKALPEPEPQS